MTVTETIVLAEVLADARRRGLTVDRVAALTGVPADVLARWTHGGPVPERDARRVAETVAAELARTPPHPLRRGVDARTFGDALRRRREWAGMDVGTLAGLAGTDAATVLRLEESDEPPPGLWAVWDRCMAATLPPRPPGWDGGYENDAQLCAAGRAPRQPGYWEKIDGWWAAFREGWAADSGTPS